MFRITRSSSADVEREVGVYSGLGLRLEFLSSRGGLQIPKLPAGFAHDLSRSRIGKGRDRFRSAVRAFVEWKQFELGWVRVANPGAPIQAGQIVAVEIQAIGLFSLNLSQIVDVISDDEAFGFIYKTTPHHAEEGEERFLLAFDPDTDEVHYELEAVSRPQHWLACLGYPVTRAFQHRFAEESHKRIRE